MKLIQSHVSRLILGLTLILSLTTSCTEDWWHDYDSSLIGTWRIVECTGYTNYRQGDTFTFYANGDFASHGYSLNERGYWDTDGRTINISFDGYNVDLSAYVRQYSDTYMVLDVNDYYDNTRYTLRLTRGY